LAGKSATLSRGKRTLTFIELIFVLVPLLSGAFIGEYFYPWMGWWSVLPGVFTVLGWFAFYRFLFNFLPASQFCRSKISASPKSGSPKVKIKP
jgi:nitrate reductase NapE component